jgi:bacterioferritin-associated ferredoxin
VGCGKCIAICPGLAITLVDFRKDLGFPIVTLPYEVKNFKIEKGDKIICDDINGNYLGKYEVIEIVDIKSNNRTQLIKVKVPEDIAKKVVSFKIQEEKVSEPKKITMNPDELKDDEMICLCERVTAGEIRKLIKIGIRDLNQIKAITRAGMGPCGSKTCDSLIKQLFREEGVDLKDIGLNTRRPLFIEVPLGKFAGDNGGTNE